MEESVSDGRAARLGPRRWLDALLIVTTVVLLVVFARHVDWPSTLGAVRRADLTLLALAVAADLTSIVVKGLRWVTLLNAVGARGALAGIRDTIVGAALNNLLIANGGDAARAAIAARRSRTPSADVLAVLAVDRFCDVAVYVALFGALALAVTLPGPFARWSIPAIVALMGVAVLSASLVARRAPVTAVRHATPHADLFGARGSATPGIITRTVRGGSRYLGRLRRSTASVAAGRRLALALVLSGLIWGGQWATFHLTARAAALPISQTGSLLALLAVNASFVVRVTPGNVGVFQLLYVLAATAAGVDRNRALAVGLLVQLVQYIPVTGIGLLLAPGFMRDSWRGPRPPLMAPPGELPPS